MQTQPREIKACCCETLQFWGCLLPQPKLTNTPRDRRASPGEVHIRDQSKACLKENEGQLERLLQALRCCPPPCQSRTPPYGDTPGFWQPPAMPQQGRKGFWWRGNQIRMLKVKFLPIHSPLFHSPPNRGSRSRCHKRLSVERLLSSGIGLASRERRQDA